MSSKLNDKRRRFAEINTPRFLGATDEGINTVKLEICYAIERVMMRYQFSYNEAAFWMGTSPSNVSRLANKKIEHFTLSQLFRYLNAICPQFRFFVSVDASLSSARPKLPT